MSFFFSAGLRGSAIPDSGVMRLTFDDADTDSGSALDVWNDNDGNINGATTGVSGANQTYTTGEAYSFDGSDDDVELPEQLLSDGSSMSVAFWFDANTLGSDDRIMSISPSHEFLANIGRSGTDKIGVRWRDGDNNATDYDFRTISTNTWYHYVFTFNSTSGDITGYIDATEEFSETGVGSTPDTTNSVIGQRGGNGFYDGRVDDVRLYDKPLSSTEVSNLYNTGSIDG